MNKKFFMIFPIIIFAFTIFFLNEANNELQEIYKNNESPQIFDRNNDLISIIPNDKNFYAQYIEDIPEDFKKLIIEKEDKYFYIHKGVNPVSVTMDLLSKIGLTLRNGSSTITQQLAKILLKNENNRTIKNKLKELFYSISLELMNSKENILLMYVNSIYFGNQIQGLETASYAYFNSNPNNLTKEEMLQLISSVNSPNQYNPKENESIEKSKIIAKKLNVNFDEEYFLKAKDAKNNLASFKKSTIVPLEIRDYTSKKTKLSIDYKLNEVIRKSLKENIENLQTKKAKNVAAIVISIPDNEIISMIGSPDPTSDDEGYQINMLKQPRQIASTIKPFIYLKAFEKGMRPYTLIDDREYKYELGDFSSFYPKNYNYEYNGEITAHYALSNSINIGALKTLEFVTLNDFYNFFKDDLEQKTIQELETYGLGIAMGSLEMNLIDLAHIFTIFPNYGEFKNLKIDLSSGNNFAKKIVNERYIQLINKILNDRKTAMDQFGLVSILNLPQKNYALKTGTSVDYKDSLIVGYTPDFLVAVWVGNADNSATEGLSGQQGAGLIWNNIMDIMMGSKYNKNTQFDFSYVCSLNSGKGIEWGLEGDDIEKARDILKDDSLILNLHNNDVFLFEESSEIKLSSKEDSRWFVDDKELFDLFFKPEKRGEYKITAKSKDKQETIYIYFK
ncbi:MAG: transglycosylase domain-containing protein [Minisyncoccales bacterium]|jgi:penicillin-binding protein 1C